MMAFYTWLMRTHRNENTPISELAEELHKHSHIITRGQGYKRSRAYVQILCKTKEHLDAFEDAWKEYSAYKTECRKNDKQSDTMIAENLNLEEPGMTFCEWMIHHYLGKDTARGDLAYDMHHEGDVADLHTREDILAYLRFHRACKECIAVFKRCWRDYEKYEAANA